MCILRTFYNPKNKSSEKTYKVICSNDFDLEAAEELFLKVKVFHFKNEKYNVVFEGDEETARTIHQKVNDHAGALRMPPGTDPTSFQKKSLK